LFLQAALLEKLAAAKAREEEARKVADRDAELRRREEGRKTQAASEELKNRQEQAAIKSMRDEQQRKKEEKVANHADSASTLSYTVFTTKTRLSSFFRSVC
jgi:hypothetical protein